MSSISDTFFSDIPPLPDSYTDNINGSRMFASCYSLRKLPDLSWFDGKNTYFYTNSSIYSSIFVGCSILDEIIDLPVLKSSSTSNGFEDAFNFCCRIKEMTFKTGIDSAPRADSGWKN